MKLSTRNDSRSVSAAASSKRQPTHRNSPVARALALSLGLGLVLAGSDAISNDAIEMDVAVEETAPSQVILIETLRALELSAKIDRDLNTKTDRLASQALTVTTVDLSEYEDRDLAMGMKRMDQVIVMQSARRTFAGYQSRELMASEISPQPRSKSRRSIGEAQMTTDPAETPTAVPANVAPPAADHP